MTEIKTALISVSDKTGLPEFARRLDGLGISILSTGGTAKLLRDNGIKVTDVSSYTGFPEILGGRVKSLHPKIHGALLALRDDEDHLKDMQDHGISPIDMVVCNLYPFKQTISKPDVELLEAVENIDIGGPTMIRSAAKNYTNVAVLTSPERYDSVAEELEKGEATLCGDTLYGLAVEAFRHTAQYDSAIAGYLGGIGERSEFFGDDLSLELTKKQDLKYGENPHQDAAFYVEENVDEPCVGNSAQIAGPALSFNNILDINAALELVKEFEKPAAACIKHTNPCGAGVAENVAEAYRRAYQGDPLSAFGCIVALNRPFSKEVAELIAGFRVEKDGKKLPYFVESIIAPGVEKDAVDYLLSSVGWAERTRVLECGELGKENLDGSAKDMRRVVGGMLAQGRDLLTLDEMNLEVPTQNKPSARQMEDLRFAWMCCKHVKSNAITIAADGMLVGTGAGQMSRVDAAVAAVRKAGERARGGVLASDAFFPFPDALEVAVEAGVEAVIQPGGAKGDAAVVEKADSLGIPMVLTGNRHFLH